MELVTKSKHRRRADRNLSYWNVLFYTQTFVPRGTFISCTQSNRTWSICDFRHLASKDRRCLVSMRKFRDQLCGSCIKLPINTSVHCVFKVKAFWTLERTKIQTNQQKGKYSSIYIFVSLSLIVINKYNILAFKFHRSIWTDRLYWRLVVAYSFENLTGSSTL